MTRYPQLELVVATDQSESASLALFEQGALGVEERGEGSLNPPSVPLAAGRVQLLASFADEPAARAARSALGGRFGAELSFVVDDGWRDAWKVHFKPTRVGQRLVIRPSWEAFEPAPGDRVLTLDPGCAFGTGTHETTRLLLRELEPRVPAQGEVLDVGCGSGILSVACLLLGAARARAIDIDPDAVRVTRENAAINQVADRLQASDTPLGQLTGRYPLVLANIETRVLVPHAAELIARVAPGGTLLLSGILLPEEQRVRQAYAACELLAAPRDGEWVALVLQVAA